MHQKLVYILALVFALGLQETMAQATQYRGKRAPAFEVGHSFNNQGWYILPGITHTLGFAHTERDRIGPDSSVVTTHNPAGQMGAFLQLGRFHVWENRFFQLFDYGLDVRWLRGVHNRTRDYRFGDEEVNWMAMEGNGRFSDLWLGATTNLSHVSRIGNGVFITNAIGANLNYALVRGTRAEGAYEGTQTFEPPVFAAQLHYRLGVGFPLGNGWYIMPTIETPILGIFAWNGGHPSMRYFDTYYQPLLIGINIMKLDRMKMKPCPTEGGDGKKRKGEDGGLWDKKMRKKYGW